MGEIVVLSKKSRFGLWAAPLLAIPFLWLPMSAGADGKKEDHEHGRDRPTVCERTAATMYRACLYDVGDNLHTWVANCSNIADRTAREACRDEARGARSEETESCGDVLEARRDACDLLGEYRYDPDPLIDPTITFIDPDEIFDGEDGTYQPNPYVSLLAGHTYVLRAGEDGEETVVVHVTEDTREIEGVLCRVVLDIVLEGSDEDGELEYEAVEVTEDLFAQDDMSNVYYCGEVSQDFEDGLLRSLDGSFEAGYEFAKAGILIRANPVVGDADRQEFSLGEAEDIIQYVDLAAAPSEEEGGDNEVFPCEPGNCLKTLEFAPIEPAGSEFKYYLPDVGFVLGVSMEDGEFTGERDELACVGDSLDVLEDCEPAVPDPDALLGALCSLAPDSFCADD